MGRVAVIISVAWLLLGGLQACADRGQREAQKMAEQAEQAVADDAACQQKGKPGTEPYDTCRKDLADARARKDAIQYQKARDFDRVLGAGTDLTNDY